MKASAHTHERQTLVLKIAKTLVSVSDRRERGRTSEGQSLSPGDWPYGSQEWFEQKLWLCMTRTLGTSGLRLTGDPSKYSDLRNKTTHSDLESTTHARARDSLPLASCDNHICNKIPQGSSLPMFAHSHSFTFSDADITTADVAAASSARQVDISHPGLLQQSSNCRAGVSSLADTRRHANMPAAAFLLHDDQRQETHLQIDMLEDMTGQDQLTHALHSTFHHWHQQDSVMSEDILIHDDSSSPMPLFSQNSAIEVSNSDGDSFTHNREIISSPQFITFESTSNTMDSRNSMQSLSELLGDDSRLGSMWKRRPSYCPPGEDAAEQLHDMFLHDPDMKLFSPTRGQDLPYGDPMMFDTYDFSRASSRSSTSSSPSTCSRRDFEQLEQPSLYSYSSRPSSGSRITSGSSREAKDNKRQSSGSKKASRPTRISEDDILFQQSSMSRSVDIKTRKNPRDYSSRR